VKSVRALSSGAARYQSKSARHIATTFIGADQFPGLVTRMRASLCLAWPLVRTAQIAPEEFLLVIAVAIGCIAQCTLLV
jgi:hypothetical protein